MEKVKAECKCKKCGKTFIKTTPFFDRKRAKIFREWVTENVTMCDTCYEEEESRIKVPGGKVRSW